jgi:hypothetical protein
MREDVGELTRKLSYLFLLNFFPFDFGGQKFNPPLPFHHRLGSIMLEPSEVIYFNKNIKIIIIIWLDKFKCANAAEK